jgi:hypothetical protein
MITTNRVSQGALAKVTGVNSGLAANEHPITPAWVRISRLESLAVILRSYLR